MLITLLLSEKMVSSYGSGNTYAAGAAAAYSKGGKSWYLPSLGELQTAYDNKAAIDAALTACGTDSSEKIIIRNNGF